MGVRRAVEMVLDAPDQYAGPIYTYGPLIHNPQVLNLLRSKDIGVLDEIPKGGGRHCIDQSPWRTTES